MASGSTNNFCSRINTQLKQEDGYENDLAIYCKENGNITLLDPSGAIPNNSVNQEDLVIYATLVARVRNKSLVEQREPETLTTINFVKGKDTAPGQAPVGTSFLTTNWTDIGSVDSQLGEDLETFGMTNIDINFQGGFVPIVSIDFIDIRGATLFEQGSCSPYGAFFHQPYPIFELTIKGYYGQPVKYFLSVQKFTTSFDPGSGNYKSKAQFVGYSYAFLSDILLGFVMAAPYIEGADTKLNKIYQDYLKYYKTLGYNEGTNSFNPIKSGNEGRPLTVFNYVKKLQGLMGQGNTDQGAIAEIQNSTEINTVANISTVSTIISQLQEILGDFKDGWIELGGTEDEEVYKFGKPVQEGEDSSAIADKARKLINEYFEGDGKVPFRFDRFNELKSQITGLEKISDLINDFSFESDDQNLYILDLNTIIQQLNNTNINIQKALNDARQTFKKLANQKIKNSIGFVPTIRSFFTVLIANAELFLDILKDVSYDAEEYHNTNTTEVFNYKGKSEVQVGGTEGVFWAWPTYTEKKETAKGSESFVEVYPGTNPKFANWPEVIFVEEFLKALQQMLKDVEQEIEEPTGEGDVYDNVPGRDNYVPINAMETPFAAEDCNNHYYNLNNIDAAFKAVGERFIIASNVTGINSNNLNTSIIATAKNKFREWRKDQYSDVNKLDSVNYTLGTFHGVEYLNSGLMTPYSSAGIPFNPTKFGGVDVNLTQGITYNGNYKETSGLEGYPYVDWGAVGRSKGTNPFGTNGSWYGISSVFKDDKHNDEKSIGLIASIQGGNKFDKLNRVPVSDNNTLEPEDESLSQTAAQVVYYDTSNGDILTNSPLTKKVVYDSSGLNTSGTKKYFIISTPKFYTKTLVVVYADNEDIASRDSQFAQIPTSVKEKCFVLMVEKDLAAGYRNQIAIGGLKNYYKKYVDLKINNNSSNLDFESEFNGFKIIEIGYGTGAQGLFKYRGINNDSLIGLADPSLITTGSNLTNANRWSSKTRMTWGSDGLIGTFSETNYNTLQNTIKKNSGKSNKIKSLDHSIALKAWFGMYSTDVDDIIKTGYQAGFTDRLVIKTPKTKIQTTPVPPGKQNATNPEEQRLQDAKNIYSLLPNSTNSNTPLNFGDKTITRRSAKNWATIGRTEAHNFFNSVENLPLVGQMINAAKDEESGEEYVSVFYNKIIESLGITEEDTFVDAINESYRYNQPLVISKVAKKDGGAVNVFPDIHEMSGDDLIRLKKYDFGSLIQSTINQKNPTALLGVVRGNAFKPTIPYVRQKFGLSKENTILESQKIQDWVNDYYGPSFGVGKSAKNLVSEQKEGRNARVMNLKPSATGSSLGRTRFSDDYKKCMVLNTGIYYSPTYFLTQLGPKQIDGSASVVGDSEDGSPFLSSFSQMSFSVLDKLCSVDIYPDFEFYYKAFTRVGESFDRSEYGEKQRTGDFNLKYARTIHEFNNLDHQRLRDEDYNPWRSWCIIDWAFLRDTLEYNKNILNIARVNTNSQTPRRSVKWIQVNNTKSPFKRKFPFLSYSTSYSSYNNTPTKLVEDLNRDRRFAEFQVSLTNLANSFFGREPDNSGGQTPNDIDLSEVTDYRLLNWNPNEQGVLEGFSVQNSAGIPPEQIAQPASIIGDIIIDRKNENYLNVGGTLTETPFWRHNFPATENGSNVPKAYYSFAGGMVMNVADTLDHEKAGLASKSLYMGLKNDLDTYGETSKYFPGGFGVRKVGGNTVPIPWDYYDGPVNNKGERTRLKVTLTNHNEDNINVSRDTISQSTPTITTDTSYNKTKAWKGSLAYLFLANQYHKPWTGMYSSSLNNLGPQGVLGSSSSTQSVPAHSVFMLGAVLWRMRESGLLESDDPKWNMESKITGGLDPVNYPKLPKKLNLGGNVIDTENFIASFDVEDLPPDGSQNYVTNQGVRPPQLSFITAFNATGTGKDAESELDTSVLCFPRADEWPVPNSGALYAYDFFGDKNVKNPFKNQYKIFTQVLSTFNISLLRYLNQNTLWSTTSVEAEEFQQKVIEEFQDKISDLKDYSDSAKASIQEELGAYAQTHIEEQLKKFTDGTIPPGLEALLDASKNFAGVEEGFTRFTAIAHTLANSIKNVDAEKLGLDKPKRVAKLKSSFEKKNVNIEDGRYRLINSNTKTEADDFDSIDDWKISPNDVNPNATTQRVGGPNFGGNDTIIGIDSNTSKSFSSDNNLFNGLGEIDDEYVEKYGKVIVVKTYDELKNLYQNREYTDENGKKISIKSIYAELPYAEKVVTKVVTPEEKLYQYIDTKGFPKDQKGYEQIKTFNNFLFPNRFQANYKSGYDDKVFKALYGQINFHAADSEQNFIGDASITVPQVNELNGGYTLKYTVGGSGFAGAGATGGKDGGAIVAEYLFDYRKYFYPQRNGDGANTALTYRTKEMQESINDTWALGISSANLKKYLYSFYGTYQRRTGLGININANYGNVWDSDAENDIVYDVLEAKIGRQFIVIPTEIPKDTTTDDSTSLGNLTEKEQILKRVYKNIGQLRGYLPIGPEIWFMPTAVKEKFINEFESYVGDFNNFLGDSDFDGTLEIIDPVNFPTPEKTNAYPGVFENEITYPTIFEEFGTVGCSAPTILKPTEDTDVSKFRDLKLDKRGLPLIPTPLAKWLTFYTYGLGAKPVSTRFGFVNVQVREQKTPVITKLDDPIAKIYGSLFNSVYTISYPTPRIWWGEFPLKKEGDNLVETTNQYFRFGKQELYAYLLGFMKELLGVNIFPYYKDKLKEKYLDSLSAEALGANQDEDLRLTVYKSLKNIYDRWISASPGGKSSGERRLFFNPIGENRLLIDHFSFVNRVNQDIGDRALINLDTVNSLFYNTRNSIYGVTSDVLDGSNFNFFPLPSYVDLSAGTSLFTKTNQSPNTRQNAIKDMFRPLSTQEYFNTTLANSSGPHFLCQYVGGNSSELELSNNKEKGCLDDQTKRRGKEQYKGTSFSQDPDKNEAPPDFTEENENSNGVVGFKVKFGSDTQSHFLGVNLDQAEFKNTLEALNAIDKIANSGTDGGSGGFVAKGQSLYEVFLNRSYNCTIEALGNAMIQPLQYFELENVPMFYGTYLIMDVKHSIRPHTMKTTFTGNRVPYATIPIVEDIISSFNLKPTQNGSLSSLSSGVSNGRITPGSSNLGSASQAVLNTSAGLYLKGGSKNHLFVANVSNGLAGTFLRQLMTDYNNFVQTNYPGKNWSFSSNGVTRSLEDTVKGGPNRSKTSLHGAGLAIDVQFLGTFKQSDGSSVTLGNAYDKKGSFPGERRYGYSSGNYTAVQDTEFVESIYNFLTTTEPWKTQITWGATFYGYCKTPSKCKNIPGVPIRENLSGGDSRYKEFNLAVNEVHHFEIKTSFQEQYWKPYKEVLEKFQLPYPPKNGKERQRVYEYPFENPSALDSDVPTTPQGDAVAGTTNIDPNLQNQINGPSTQAVDYGITDYQLFTYLAWQQGAGGAAQHYSLWKRNGKKSKYSIPVKNIKANWPGSYEAKNGVKKGDVDNLYSSNQNKLAEGFVDVQRQLYAKKLKTGLDLINSNGKNRSGVSYSSIKNAFEKHQSPPEVDFNNLVAFGTIENGLQTDTKKGKTFITMFQMNSKSGSYDSVLNKLTRKKSIYSDDFEDFENIDVLTASAVPKMISNFETFKRVSGFV